jgi:hypothetical protein
MVRTDSYQLRLVAGDSDLAAGGFPGRLIEDLAVAVTLALLAKAPILMRRRDSPPDGLLRC